MLPTHEPKTEKSVNATQHDRADRSLILTTTLILTICIMGAIAFLSQKSAFRFKRASTQPFTLLHRIYQEGGLSAFLAEKELLKESVRDIIQERTTKAAEAVNIAVFLFPDILPDGNFEKSEALELWQPHQLAIEKAPHTVESRRKFEDMRANIYGYENPDRENLQLSKDAKQVIRIYDTLSAP